MSLKNVRLQNVRLQNVRVELLPLDYPAPWSALPFAPRGDDWQLGDLRNRSQSAAWPLQLNGKIGFRGFFDGLASEDISADEIRAHILSYPLFDGDGDFCVALADFVCAECDPGGERSSEATSEPRIPIRELELEVYFETSDEYFAYILVFLDVNELPCNVFIFAVERWLRPGRKNRRCAGFSARRGLETAGFSILKAERGTIWVISPKYLSREYPVFALSVLEVGAGDLRIETRAQTGTFDPETYWAQRVVSGQRIYTFQRTPKSDKLKIYEFSEIISGSPQPVPLLEREVSLSNADDHTLMVELFVDCFDCVWIVENGSRVFIFDSDLELLAAFNIQDFPGVSPKPCSMKLVLAPDSRGRHSLILARFAKDGLEFWGLSADPEGRGRQADKVKG